MKHTAVNLNKKILLPLLLALSGLFFLVGPVLAVPVLPDDVTLVQPDGTTFTASPFGDEWSSGYEYAGYTILKNSVDDTWYYAQQIGAGQLVASSQQVVAEEPLGLSPHLRDTIVESQISIGVLPGINAAPAEGSGGITAAPAVWGGVSGSQPLLILLVDFIPTESQGTTAADWHAALFSDSAGAKSVKNFYDEASFGQFSIDPAAEIQGTVNDGIVEVTLAYSHPNTQGTSGEANRQIVQDALNAADAYVDFNSFDTNNNGYLDVTELHLITIPRGYETSIGGEGSACTPGVWGHRSALFGTVSGPLLDGVIVADANGQGGYMQFGERHETNPADPANCTGGTGNMATIGIMAHELGHDIDWPDFYDTDYTSSGIGYWSIMASGSWGRESGEPSGTTPTLPDAFSKWYQGWITPTQIITTATSIAIPTAAENGVAYQILDNPNGIDWDFGSSSGTGEYFLVENRQQVGFDAGLYSAGGSGTAGCVIWHIDETVTSSNAINNDQTHKHVDVEEASAVQELDLKINQGDANDTWPGSNNLTSFGASSTPNSNLYSGSASQAGLFNISTAGTGCTVDFIVPPNLELSAPITVAHTVGEALTYTTAISNVGSFTLNWTIAEDTPPAAVAPSGSEETTIASAPVIIPEGRTIELALEGKAPQSAPSASMESAPTAVAAATSGVSMILDDGSLDTLYGLTLGGSFLWFNRFTPAAADFSLRLDEISVYFYNGYGVAVGDQITLYVYEDTDGDSNPTTGASLVDTFATTVQAVNAFNVYTLDPAPVLNGPGDVLIGVYNNTAGTAAGDFPVAADTTSSQSRSWRGSTNPAAWVQPAGYNWMIRAAGTALDVACQVPGDVSWLSLSATSGSTISNTVSPLDVTLDATGLSVGTYEAVLCIDSNDPGEPQAQLPISMSVCNVPVTPSATDIAISGSDLDLSWSGSATQFEVWWSTDPYFTPGSSCAADPNCAVAAGNSYTHSGAAAAGDNYYYLIQAADTCGTGIVTGASADQMGKFIFAVVPGS